MPLRLASHVYCADAGAQMVLLDTRRSRFFGVSETVRAMLLSATADEEAGDKRPLEPLRRAGLLIEREDGNPSHERLMPISAQGEHRTRAGEHRIAPLLIARALAVQVDSLRRLNREPLECQVARLKTMKSRPASGAARPQDAEVIRRVAQFRRTHAILSPTDRCLAKSIALFRFLVPVDGNVDLVIGVRTAPFAAHAWVQRDGILLDDKFDRVRLFTPILAL